MIIEWVKREVEILQQWRWVVKAVNETMTSIRQVPVNDCQQYNLFAHATCTPICRRRPCLQLPSIRSLVSANYTAVLKTNPLYTGLRNRRPIFAISDIHQWDESSGEIKALCVLCVCLYESQHLFSSFCLCACMLFSARCNIAYISRLCYDVSVRLSATEVHWRIIANFVFKFRSKFTAHCGRGEG